MEKLTNEQRAQRKETAVKWSREESKRKDAALKKLPEEVSKYLGSSYRNDEGVNSVLGKKLADALRDGSCKKPSDFVKSELSQIFGTLVPESMKESLLYSVDECRRWSYSMGYSRRPFRSGDYSLYLGRINAIICAYAVNSGVKLPFEDIVSGKMSEEERAVFDEYPNQRNEYDIAYCIDKGCPTTIQYISELLDGSSSEQLTYSIFTALFMSKSTELYELAGRLLLAARLQEGLRQAICETCDCGSYEAFRYMIGVITDNDLYRFASVKRAFGTWTGLAAADADTYERIAAKTLVLINGCLKDDAFREECLSSDDAMKVDVGLWSAAVTEVKDCKSLIDRYCKSGTHPQVMAAAYFIRELWDAVLTGEAAKMLLLTRSDELDVMSLIEDLMFKGVRVTDSKRFKPAEVLKNSFADRAEAELAYAKLMGIYEAIPKKSLEFSPCVFPWNKSELTKSKTVKLLAYIAAMLEDNDKKDFICQRLADIDVSSYGTRRTEIELLLSDPQTDIQLDMLVAEIADREEYSRGAAYMQAQKNKDKFKPKHYLMLEDMLRYKSSDIRSHVLTLMMGLGDDELFESVKRLISDKKEEKRTAGLDLIMQLGKDSERSELYARCLPLTELIKNPTTKEQILIDSLSASGGGEQEKVFGYGLYTEEDSFSPSDDFGAYGEECRKVFLKYFPSGKAAGGKGKAKADFEAPLKALDKLIEDNKNLEFTDFWGDKMLLGSARYLREKGPDGAQIVPFGEMWDKFYEEHIGDPVLLFRMKMAVEKPVCLEKGYELFGEEYRKLPTLAHIDGISSVLGLYYAKRLDVPELRKAAFALAKIICDSAAKGENLVELRPYDTNYWHPTSAYIKEGKVIETDKQRVLFILDDSKVQELFGYFGCSEEESFKQSFSLSYLLAEKTGGFKMSKALRGSSRASASSAKTFFGPDTAHYIRAAYKGVITEGFMYRHFFEQETSVNAAVETVCGIAKSYRDSERKRMTRQRWSGWRSANALARLLGSKQPEINDENRPLVEYAVGVYERLTALILDSELKRGDSPAEFTGSVRSIGRIYGADRFVQILSALGKDTLERGGGYSSNSLCSKRESLSRLLGVCVPREDDSAEKLAALLKGTDITEKRLVEAALYSPEWINIVGEHLGWEGFRSACFYFMAHMNESFDDVKKAMIAKFTPISTEELAQGAFDIEWFREAYGTVGVKRFDMIYDAAKYITDGARHSRARKYADAVLGRLDRSDAEKQIKDKRNKDTLMAFALIPIKDEDDIFSRYLLFRQFLKESRKFGAQRRASESAASDMAMRNLAENAGYSDVTRLTLRMETKLFDDIRPLTEPNVIEDITARLAVSEDGRAELICEKGGKALKSVPAKHKKNELILQMGEVKKQLTEQYRRTRTMLEQAMEDRTEFLASELEALQSNPVVWPLVRELVFVSGNDLGFFADMKLTSAEGKAVKLSPDSRLIAAHPFDLYTAGCWREYQQLLFEHKRVQPFKQVFRELYVKTEEEKEAFTSLRYAGNQIQPKQTVGCLKNRRWVADVEDGLQKVYYKENIIARIYALADWFSPADIEAPTLEWVDFFDRKTGKQMRISDIPDIIFSEVMRDVDLAVSVAHAGGVDPETSHSTVEMRRNICEFTMPMFGLKNVTFEKSRAFIKGSRADYSIHLGSGVIHMQGGPMINVLPVHSQHKGKLFLPFLDEDPKTAQIISEILLFAEDDKIKDPFILDQIR